MPSEHTRGDDDLAVPKARRSPEIDEMISRINVGYASAMLGLIRRRLNRKYQVLVSPEDIWQDVLRIVSQKKYERRSAEMERRFVRGVVLKCIKKVIEKFKAQKRDIGRTEQPGSAGLDALPRRQTDHKQERVSKKATRRHAGPAVSSSMRKAPDSTLQLRSLQRYLHPSKMTPSSVAVQTEAVQRLMSRLRSRRLQNVARLLMREMTDKEIASILECPLEKVVERIQEIRSLLDPTKVRE